MGLKVVVVILLIIGAAVGGIFLFTGDEESNEQDSQNADIEETTPLPVRTEQEKLQEISSETDENGTIIKSQRTISLSYNESIDEALISREDDRLNLGETLVDVMGPRVFESTFGTFLKKKTIRNTYTGKSVSYEQKLGLSPVTKLEEFEDREYINTSDEYVGFVLEEDEQVLNYTISFIERTTWEDLIGMTLRFLGRDYYIIGELGDHPKFKLFDEPYVFDIEEGETVIINHPSLGKNIFDVERVDADGAELSINNNKTIEYEQGEDYVEQNMHLYIEDISYSPTKASRVSIVISPRILDLAREEITLEGEVLEGMKVEYQPLTGDKIDEMTLYWEIDEKTFVTNERSLTMPYFENIEFSMIDTTYELDGKLYTNVSLVTKVYELLEEVS